MIGKPVASGETTPLNDAEQAPAKPANAAPITKAATRRRRGGQWRGDHREVAERRYGKGRRVSTDAEQRALREVEGAELAEHELITQAQQRVDADQGHQALTEGWQDGERQHRRQDQQD